MLVGLGPTKAGWSGGLRGFIRDHTADMTAVTVLDGRQLSRAGKRRFDVVILDDATRIFTPDDVARVAAEGTVVVGLYGTDGGMGAEWLARHLGVARAVPVDVGVGELAALIARIGPVGGGPVVDVAADRPQASPPMAGRGRHGVMSVWSSVSGGAGLTEALIATAEVLAERSTVLVIEANPVSAVLAARLRRDPSYGLGWVLSRIGQAPRALPGGLSPSHPDLGAGPGRFDVICGSTTPGGPGPLDPARLAVLVEEAKASYAHVLIDIGPLVASPPAGGAADRFRVGWAMLARADRAVIFAAPDPEGATRLVDWRAATLEAGSAAPAEAVFGRVPVHGSFEWSHLLGLLSVSTGRSGFAGIHRLPEDRTVSRARWNGELVWKGRWLNAVRRLAATVAQPAQPRVDTAATVLAGRPRSLASEVRW